MGRTHGGTPGNCARNALRSLTGHIANRNRLAGPRPATPASSQLQATRAITDMVKPIRNFLDSLSEGLQKIAGVETQEQRTARETRQLHAAVAMLLYETARADHEVTYEDLQVANECLSELLALTREQARKLMQQAAKPHERPTSYHPLVKAVNEQFSAGQKLRLIEYMWRVAHADEDVDKYEDHLIRKISELIYVHHRDFIAAKHRARAR
jgi:uncharacterized tellurite resistance protein B-like protein